MLTDTGNYRAQTGKVTCLGMILLLSIACLDVSQTAADDPLPAARAIKPELYATGFEFAEGPALDDEGNLFVVNYRRKGTIGRITPDGTASIWCDVRELAPVEDRLPQANGLKIDSANRLIAADAGCGRLLRVSADGKQVDVLADRCEGVRFNSVNDVALDRFGNIYFSDPGGSSAEQPIGSVYRYDIRTNRTSPLAAGLAFPNGLAVTPDQRQLCVAESQRQRVLIFDLDPKGGEISNQRVLIEFPKEDQGDFKGGAFPPDGMTFDSQGRLYVAMWTGGVINVVDIERGALLRQYDAGGMQATNVHFHDGYLYVTVAAKEAVFRLNLGVSGVPYRQLLPFDERPIPTP